MKHPLFGFALAVLVALSAGCANSGNQPYLASSMKRANSYALAVTVNGGLQPTPMQWAAIQAKFADEFSWRGWVLVTDLALADYIVRVDFTPDALDPENTGTVAVLGIRNNPRNVLASTTTMSHYPTSFGYAGSFQNALWSPGYSNMYYGWGDSYYDGYSYSSPTLNPVKPPTVVTPHPPYRHRNPGDTAWCPPDRTNLPPRDHDHKRPPSFLPGDFAAPLPPTTTPAPTIASNERSHRWSENRRSADAATFTRSDSGSWRDRNSQSGSTSDSSGSTSSSGITYSRGGSSTSSSDRTYARGDSTGSRDWSSWRDRNSRSDSTGSGSASSRSDSSSSSWRDRSSQSGSTYSRSDSGYSRSGSGSDSSSSSRGSWGGSSSSRSDSGSSYSHSHSGSDSGYSRGSYSSSSGSSGGSYSGSSHSSGSSSSSSSGSSGGSSSSSSGNSSSTGSVSSTTTQQN